jgi:hypothetical protein
MISEQTVLNTPVPNPVSGTWRAPAIRHHAEHIRGAAYRLVRIVYRWVRIAVLPYAALWEASLIAGQLDDRKTFKPDPFSTETSFLTDSWLRG